jgi:hypothetical protein
MGPTALPNPHSYGSRTSNQRYDLVSCDSMYGPQPSYSGIHYHPSMGPFGYPSVHYPPLKLISDVQSKDGTSK